MVIDQHTGESGTLVLSKQWGQLLINRKPIWIRDCPPKSQESKVTDTLEVEGKEDIKWGEVVQVTLSVRPPTSSPCLYKKMTSHFHSDRRLESCSL